MRNKVTAGFLALFVGNFGGHHFYLERYGRGILYAVFFWTFIPGIVGFCEAINFFFFVKQEEFDRTYNSDFLEYAKRSVEEKMLRLTTMKEKGLISEEQYGREILQLQNQLS